MFAHLATVGAHVTQVIVEGQSRNLLLAVQMARNGVQDARQQMSLIINQVKKKQNFTFLNCRPEYVRNDWNIALFFLLEWMDLPLICAVRPTNHIPPSGGCNKRPNWKWFWMMTLLGTPVNTRKWLHYFFRKIEKYFFLKKSVTSGGRDLQLSTTFGGRAGGNER